MSALEQDPKTKLIGSAHAIADLAQKDSARILVVSDSHGAAVNLRFIVLENGAECDALVFCGDGISDIAALAEQAIGNNTLAECIPPVIALVQGNNDFDIYPFVNPRYTEGSGESYYTDVKVPLTQTLTVCGHSIFIAHGHRHSLYGGTQYLEAAAMNAGAECVLYGHTHVAQIINRTGLFVMNPGSCARPRAGQPPCFAKLSVTKEYGGFSGTIYELNASGSSPYVPKTNLYW